MGLWGGGGGVRLKCGDEYEESRGKMWAEKFFLFPAGCIVFRFGACRKLAAWARRLSVRFLSFRDNSFALLLARFVQILLRWASARGPLEASCIRRNFFFFSCRFVARVCVFPPLCYYDCSFEYRPSFGFVLPRGFPVWALSGRFA